MVKVHNVKFYKPEPRAIYCMSLHKRRQKLALSRSDSSIEIWDLNEAPFVEKVIPASSNYDIQSIIWSNDRLFSCTLQGFLHEYNLYTLMIKENQSLIGEAAYCLDVNRDKTNIVVGTENGYLNIFDITDGVQFVKFLDKQEGKILCVKYDPSGQFIASGSIDAVRIWDTNTGNALHKMMTGRSENNTPTIIWCLEVTQDLTIITGDSRGKLTFWDGKIGAQIESYQSHKADILALTLSEDENMIFCAGTDPILISYVKVKIKEQMEKWVKSIQRRVHDHDVRALFLFNEKLYSGGVDGYLVCSYHPPKTVLKYAPLFGNRIKIANSKRIILLQYADYIEVWSLGTTADSPNKNGRFQLKDNPKKLLHLERSVKDDNGKRYREMILDSALSPSGKWIAFSTLSGCRLYEFICTNEEKVEINPVVLPSECEASVRLTFSSASRELIMALCSGNIIVLNIKEVSISQTITTENIFTDTILHLLTSPNGKFLIAADCQSNINVWRRHKSWRHPYKLARYQHAPTAIAVQPSTNNLWISYSDHKVAEHMLDDQLFTDFSKFLNPETIQNYLNGDFPIRNITFDPDKSNIILLHDDSNIVVINKDKEPSEELPNKIAKISHQNKKNKTSFTSIRKYQHLVHLGSLSQDEFVVVETTPLALMEQLPPCLKQSTFGTA